MITERIQCRNLDRGNLVILNNDQSTVYRVIINSDDEMILEELYPVHQFLPWSYKNDKFKWVEIIKSS